MKQEPLVRLLGVTKKISSKVLVDHVTLDIPLDKFSDFLGRTEQARQRPFA